MIFSRRGEGWARMYTGYLECKSQERVNIKIKTLVGFSIPATQANLCKILDLQLFLHICFLFKFPLISPIVQSYFWDRLQKLITLHATRSSAFAALGSLCFFFEMADVKENPVFLGIPDAEIDEQNEKTCTWDTNKLGGYAVSILSWCFY